MIPLCDARVADLIRGLEREFRRQVDDRSEIHIPVGLVSGVPLGGKAPAIVHALLECELAAGAIGCGSRSAKWFRVTYATNLVMVSRTTTKVRSQKRGGRSQTHCDIAQLCNRGVAVDGHEQVGLGEDGAEDVNNSIRSIEGQAVGIRAPDADGGCSHRKRFDDV